MRHGLIGAGTGDGGRGGRYTSGGGGGGRRAGEGVDILVGVGVGPEGGRRGRYTNRGWGKGAGEEVDTPDLGEVDGVDRLGGRRTGRLCGCTPEEPDKGGYDTLISGDAREKANGVMQRQYCNNCTT